MIMMQAAPEEKGFGGGEGTRRRSQNRGVVSDAGQSKAKYSSSGRAVRTSLCSLDDGGPERFESPVLAVTLQIEEFLRIRYVDVLAITESESYPDY
jgi:hypothetical protein